MAENNSNIATLVIKNPSKSSHHFTLEFSLDGTLGELQQVLSRTYDGKPQPSEQTVRGGHKKKGRKAFFSRLLPFSPTALFYTHARTCPAHVQLIYGGKVLKDMSVKVRDLVSKVSQGSFWKGSVLKGGTPASNNNLLRALPSKPQCKHALADASNMHSFATAA